MLIVGALMIASAVASASTVTWGAAAASSIDATKITTGTFYLAYATGDVDFTKFEGQASFSADTLALAGFSKVIDTFTFSSTKANNKNNQITPAATGLSGTISAYAILIGDEIGGEQYLAYATTPVSFSVAAAAGMNQTKVSTNFNYVAATVPEPTSGLLILLGMGALALRRRRA